MHISKKRSVYSANSQGPHKGTLSMNKVSQAEKEIAKILMQLEIDTDCVVDQISLEDMDVTNIDSDGPVLLRCVRIETRRLPSSDWGTFHEA